MEVSSAYFYYYIRLRFVLNLLYFFRGHGRGEKWIVAHSKDSKSVLPNYELLLRSNDNFTVEHSAVDFGCSYSGTYQKNGDTIFLDQKVIEKVGSQMTPVYLKTSKELIPVSNTLNKIVFTIAEIN